MPGEITLVIHHRGKFSRNEDGHPDYVDGELDCWEEIDTDTLNIFLLTELCEIHGYGSVDRLFWLAPNINLEIGLRPLVSDSDILQLCEASSTNDREIEIFVEHPISIPEIVPLLADDASKDCAAGEGATGDEFVADRSDVDRANQSK